MDTKQSALPGAAVAGAAAAGDTSTSAGTDSKLTKVADFAHQVTGVSVTADGRTFVCFPRWTDDAPISVAELLPGAKLRAYPDENWNSWRNAKANEMPVGEYFVCVQSIVADGQGALWVLDPAAPGNEKIMPGGPKLVRIDLATDQVTQTILFDETVALQGTYLNDIRFSADGRTGYITDSGTRGAIIVVDLDTGDAFRALDGHKSTQVEKDVIVEIDGKPLRRPDGRQPSFSSDSIAISNDRGTLYWQALTGRTLYSIDVAKLTKGTPTAETAKAVTIVGTTNVADGLWMGSDDTLYVTSPTDNSVKYWTGDSLEPVVTDKRLRWPDTLSEGPDGTIYVTASHIQDTNWYKPGAPASLPTALFSFRR